MKAHDMRIAWCLRPFVTWPLGTPSLSESEREVDLGTGIVAPKGEVIGGREKVNGIIGTDEGENGRDAMQEDVTTKTWLSLPLPPGDSRLWEMPLVFTRGHIIPARDFTPRQHLPPLGVSTLTTHIRVLLGLVEHSLPVTEWFLRHL